MADTVDPAASLSPADEAEQPRDARSEVTANGRAVESKDDGERPAVEAEEPQDAPSVTEFFEQLGRELSELGLSEAQLEAARNMPEVRRAARDISGVLVLVVAALAAFALINVAAVDGLSKVMTTWLAALVLAAVWGVVVAVLLFAFMGRARRWLLWLLLKEPPTEAVEELKQKRDDTGRAARTTLERLGPALAVQIALAAVPKVGDVAGDVAGGVIEVGDSVLEASDDFVEAVAEQIPGGGVVNQVWDVVLVPGRFGVRVATTVLRRGKPAD